VAGNTSIHYPEHANVFDSFSGSANLTSGDPQLAPLGNYGGPTLTMPPLPGSPAIDAGDDSATNSFVTDQRGPGFPRFVGLHVDIGAFEVPPAPTVTTEPVTEIAATQATLQGTANPKGTQTEAWFEYGLGANYGNETPKQPMSNSTNAQPFSSRISGLLPWMTYHYRAVGANILGWRTDGPDMTFTVPAPSVVAAALSPLQDVTLPQGGSTNLAFTVSSAGLDVRVSCNNPVLLPDGTLVLSATGTSKSLELTPNPNQSGAAQVTVAASDGTHSASDTFNLTVTPAAGNQQSPLLYLAGVAATPPHSWQFRVVDLGTGSTNYAVEYRSDLSPTNSWTTATNVTDMGNGLYEVDVGPPHGDTGFYRVKGFRLLMAGLDSSALTVTEGENGVGPVVEFNGIYTGTITCIWTDEQGNSWTNQVAVNGTTTVLPVPSSYLGDNTAIGQLKSLTVQLEGGAGFALGATTQNRVTIEENDANWRGMLQTSNGPLDFTLTLLQTNGGLQGTLQSDGFGFFPTNVPAQLTFTENAFTLVATNMPLPVLTAYAGMGFTNYLDLRLDATNSASETNVNPTQIQGVATLVSRAPGRSYLDAAVFGPFVLLKPPTAPSTNDVPLYPVP
jgi:hypothetical protein